MTTGKGEWHLPALREVSGEFFIFWHDSDPAHRAHDTVEFLQQETPAFISPDQWPPNSPDLNPVYYKIWGVSSSSVSPSRGSQHRWAEAASVARSARHWTMHHWQFYWRMTLGVFELASGPREGILSSCCNSINNSWTINVSTCFKPYIICFVLWHIRGTLRFTR